MRYKIDVDLDAESLRTIYRDGQYVTLVKHTGATAPSPGVVTWVSFAPFQRNRVAWNDERSVYASNTRLRPGEPVDMLVSTVAELGRTYFLEAGTFEQAPSGVPAAYTVVNGDGRVAFGLAQTATVNSISMSAPTNVVPLLGRETVIFTPSEEVSIFLAPFRDGGMLLHDVPANALRVRLSPAGPSARVTLDVSTKAFVASYS